MTEEGFRQKYFRGKPELGKTATQYMTRLENYLVRWIQLSGTEESFDALKDLFLREQLIFSCSKEVSMFLQVSLGKEILSVVKRSYSWQKLT